MLQGKLHEFLNENGLKGPATSSNYERPILQDNPTREKKGDFLILKKPRIIGEDEMPEQHNFKVIPLNAEKAIADIKNDKVLGKTLYSGPEPKLWNDQVITKVKGPGTQRKDYWEAVYGSSSKGEEAGKSNRNIYCG